MAESMTPKDSTTIETPNAAVALASPDEVLALPLPPAQSEAASAKENQNQEQTAATPLTSNTNSENHGTNQKIQEQKESSAAAVSAERAQETSAKVLKNLSTRLREFAGQDVPDTPVARQLDFENRKNGLDPHASRNQEKVVMHVLRRIAQGWFPMHARAIEPWFFQFLEQDGWREEIPDSGFVPAYYKATREAVAGINAGREEPVLFLEELIWYADELRSIIRRDFGGTVAEYREWWYRHCYVPEWQEWHSDDYEGDFDEVPQYAEREAPPAYYEINPVNLGEFKPLEPPKYDKRAISDYMKGLILGTKIKRAQLKVRDWMKKLTGAKKARKEVLMWDTAACKWVNLWVGGQ